MKVHDQISPDEQLPTAWGHPAEYFSLFPLGNFSGFIRASINVTSYAQYVSQDPELRYPHRGITSGVEPESNFISK
jgi:hypothetical protein